MGRSPKKRSEGKGTNSFVFGKNNMMVTKQQIHSTILTIFPMAMVFPSSLSMNRPICGKFLNKSMQNCSLDSILRMHLSSCFTNLVRFLLLGSFLSIVQITA